ncbi:uncharacterized protein KNN_07156 (plasmid) [Bacillus thuringiensis serovar tolworthi]|uniref:Uncharacterized protein n=1 Tax=Bacillus thuringiensis subsp. tolworthi TaxID=1442 RepID=A0A9W4AFY5_BACTO|nr:MULTISPECIES: hypothetical protein [Bacillus cereus group]MEB9590237.1 hypothetical protein [Bacillus cereus]MRD28078.1 hypothetical protein [Bacillus thuringiensis]BAR87889.1 uncharacterized protein KNN_07156 [Bacillus thuringiensis serovar tolworthi]
MHVVTIYDGNMNRINTHFTGSKPTFQQLADFKNRYENAEYVESNERFADFEIREGERKERIANEAKQAELERIKQAQQGTQKFSSDTNGPDNGLHEGGTN